MVSPPTAAPTGFLPRAGLDRLLDLLKADGRRVVGPTVSGGAIVYDEIHRAADLPSGWTADQAPGEYRLRQTGTDRQFDYAVGPTSWKRETFPPHVPITIGRRVDGQTTFEDVPPAVQPVAFLGVRGCEIAALLTQDAVLATGPAVDRDYAARRAAALVIAVECVTPADTCFCTSMGTGPEVTAGFDLAMTELDDGFVVRAGTPAGERLLARLDLAPADEDRRSAARSAVQAARDRIGDPVPTAGLPARLIAAADSPRWAEIAERCLACANCTLVCPTCFCTGVTQASDLDGLESVAERTWDSCFTLGFARVAGGNFRPRVQDRYRQWLTHKFGTWWDQFGMSGCVGCGRCITWCPVGIDVREELMAVAPPPVAEAPTTAAVTAPVELVRRAHEPGLPHGGDGSCRWRARSRRHTRARSWSNVAARRATRSRSGSGPTTRTSSPAVPASSSWPPCPPSRRHPSPSRASIRTAWS